MHLILSPIRNDDDLKAALREVSFLMKNDPALDTPEGAHLDALATLIEAYERKHFPIEKPDPIEAIKFHMEQTGLGVVDLVPMIGNKNRVYEVLAKKRPLTLRMIRNLSRELGIPATALIGN